MRICVAGAYGAFGIKHLDALANIEGVEVTSVMGPTKEKIEALAKERGIRHAGTTLEECLAQPDVDAVILSTPTQLHAEQAIACMNAGKHVLVEIPMADSLEDSIAVVEKQKETGLIAMAGQVDEAVTWRLGQVADARNRSMRSQTEDRAEYDIGDNGARINREERNDFAALLARIRPRESGK